MTSNYGDRRYRARAAALKRQCERNNTPCWICHKGFDFALDWKHPMAWTADHLEALANGGRLLGDLLPAHRSCNSRRGSGKPVQNVEPPKNSRDW